MCTSGSWIWSRECERSRVPALPDSQESGATVVSVVGTLGARVSACDRKLPESTYSVRTAQVDVALENLIVLDPNRYLGPSFKIGHDVATT